MAAATPLSGTAHLNRRAFSLALARGTDYAVQLVLPIVLVRCLAPDEFGQYRLLWLVAGTVIAFATLAMPASLFYFLPRSDRETQQLYVKQTLVFLAGAGLLAAAAVGPWNPWLPESMRGLAAFGGLVPTFTMLWVVASLLDALPTADERVAWQAKTTIGLAVLRAVALSVTALVTRELGPVLWVLLGFVVFKLAVLLSYIAGFHGVRGPVLRWQLFGDQIRYAAPFGAGGALYMLRIQSDQWIAAVLFSASAFATVTIAAVLAPLLNVFRQAVSTAFMPSMSRLQAGGDVASALELNSRANLLVGTFIYPLLGFIFVFAEDVITIVYTSAYVDAAPLMRLYVLGVVPLVVELATVTQVLRQGTFMLWLNAAALVLSFSIGWIAAQRLGLIGVAVGSVSLAYLDRIATLYKLAAVTGIPVRRLQHWGPLALRLGLSAGVAALAWFASNALDGNDDLARLAVGAAIVVCTYGMLHRLLARPLRAATHEGTA